MVLFLNHFIYQDISPILMHLMIQRMDEGSFVSLLVGLILSSLYVVFFNYRFMENGGQRICTVLIYLNTIKFQLFFLLILLRDGKRKGEILKIAIVFFCSGSGSTIFPPPLDIKIFPTAGSALSKCEVKDDVCDQIFVNSFYLRFIINKILFFHFI